MKCALYCRLSEEDRNKQSKEDDSNSIQNQKSMLIQYALEHEWEVSGIYSDDDYTGSDRNRPEFNRLLEDAKSKKFDIVICKTQSRFTRELEMVEKYIHGLFPLWGIRFISIVDNADTENKGNKKSRQINGLVNEWYLEDMSENIKSVLTNRRENGFHIGAFALYGYKKDPDNKGKLLIDEEAAEIVREVFHLFLQGHGKTAITRILNARGIPNPTEYKRLKGLRWSPPKTKTATLWKYFAISDMLTNEMYIGNMVQGRYGSISYKSKINKPRPKEDWIRVENTHEPIIDKDTWNRVQELVKQRAKPFDTGNIGIFAKKVYCINCGYTMRSKKSRGKHYLQCNTSHASKDACIGAFISVEKLEQIVIERLQILCNEMLDCDEIEKGIEFQNQTSDKIKKAQCLIAQYDDKIESCNLALKNLYLDKVKGVITDIEYVQFASDFKKDKETYQNLINEQEKNVQLLQEKMAHQESKKDIILSYTNVTSLTHDMVDTLIDGIYVGKRDKETKEQKIEIHWNF